MSTTKKGLGGQGYDVLGKFLSKKENEETAGKNLDISDENTQDKVFHIDVDMIKTDSSQPRNTFNEETLSELADSMKNVGIISPVIVSKDGNFYKLIAGERRYRAARIAGIKEIPAIITDADEMKRLEISLIENIQRENLNPVDEALTYRRFKDNFALTDEQIAEKVGKSRTTVTNSLRLLKLDERVLDFLKKSLLTTGHARALITVENKELQFEFAEKIIDEQLSVRQTEEFVKEYSEITIKEKPKREKSTDTEIYSNFSDILKNLLGTKVKIKNNNKNNKGKIEIEYYSADELDRIMCLFNKINQE